MLSAITTSPQIHRFAVEFVLYPHNEEHKTAREWMDMLKVKADKGHAYGRCLTNLWKLGLADRVDTRGSYRYIPKSAKIQTKTKKELDAATGILLLRHPRV